MRMRLLCPLAYGHSSAQQRLHVATAHPRHGLARSQFFLTHPLQTAPQHEGMLLGTGYIPMTTAPTRSPVRPPPPILPGTTVTAGRGPELSRGCGGEQRTAAACSLPKP